MAKRRTAKKGGCLFLLLLIVAAAIYLYHNYGDEIRDYLRSFLDEPRESQSHNEDGSSEQSEGTTESESTEGGGEAVLTDDVEVHFLEVGNKYTGDCTYIRVGDVDILIDAGSRQSSAGTIGDYLDGYITDGILEYVIATHAHRDHIAGFVGTKAEPGIFDRYECKTIIDFPRTEATSAIYADYVEKRDAEIANGAVHYTAAELIQREAAVIELGTGVTMTVLDNYYYYNDASSENDYSVCILLSQGDLHYLFTGDLEAEGEEHLVTMNELPEVALLKAGHHGSYTATSNALLTVVKPKRVAVCCCAGSTEYTDNMEKVFPSQEFCDRVAPYTREVYVTTVITVDASGKETGFASMNGSIVFTGSDGTVTVTCSASSTPLYLTAWFREYRTCPPAWRDEE